MSQLTLGRVGDSDCWREVLDGCRDVVAVEGAKEVAFQLDVPGSVLSNALAERERNDLKAKHLPYLIRSDRSGRIIRALSAHAGMEVRPAVPMTAEEKVARLEEALNKLPAEVSRGIREMAFGRAR